jgi:hypothetical protein
MDYFPGDDPHQEIITRKSLLMAGISPLDTNSLIDILSALQN